MTTLRFLLPAILSSGCASIDPVVGSWEQEISGGDRINHMEILEDMTGDATIWLVDSEGTRHESVFSVEARNRDEALYRLEFTCLEDCPSTNADAKVDCDGDDAMETLTCQPRGWYELVWVKVG